MQQNIREVYSLLMPVANGRVVLPRAAIAEITGFTKPKPAPEGAPDFLLGFISWQKQDIPLISFEAACGKPVPETGRRSRICIVFAIEGRLKNPNAFAMVTQGYPYLVRVNEGVLQLEDSDDETLADIPVLSRTRMANERPQIPDISQLEFMIADALGITGDEPLAEAVNEELDELDALAAGQEDHEEGLVPDDGGFDITVDDEEGEIDLDSIDFGLDDDDGPGDDRD